MPPPCEHNCTNSAGSYMCTCLPGYLLTATGGCISMHVLSTPSFVIQMKMSVKMIQLCVPKFVKIHLGPMFVNVRMDMRWIHKILVDALVSFFGKDLGKFQNIFR